MISEHPRWAVVLGGSSGVGRSLARELAQAGCDILIAARDERDVKAVSSDLSLRFGIRCRTCTCDLDDAAMDVNAFVSSCQSLLPGIDAVFIPAGAVDDTDDGFSDQVTRTMVNVNFFNIARVISAFAGLFRDTGTGRIVAFSSIAAHVPRSRNVAYAAAKAALETYCRSLQHAFAGSRVRVHVYALGYVDTAMSFGRKLLFPAAQPDAVAAFVMKSRGSSGQVTFYPGFWRWIVFALNALPWSIYKRLSF